VDWQIDWDWSAPDDPDWRKVRAWGGRFKYRREYGGRLWLTPEQNSRLTGILVNVGEAQRFMTETLAKIEPGKPWRNGLVEQALTDLRTAVTTIRSATSSEFVSVDRIAVKTAHRCREHHRRVLPPRTFEANPTFRVAAGVAHKAPVVVSRDIRGAVGLGDIGWVYVETGDGVKDAWEDSAYAEIARLNTSWHVRFTWVVVKENVVATTPPRTMETTPLPAAHEAGDVDPTFSGPHGSPWD
jgi:hypothetical protein